MNTHFSLVSKQLLCDDIWNTSTASPLTTQRNSIYIFTYVFIDYEHRNKNHSFPPMSAIIVSELVTPSFGDGRVKIACSLSLNELDQKELEVIVATHAAGKFPVSDLFNIVIRRRIFVTGIKLLSNIVLPVVNNLVNLVSTFPGIVWQYLAIISIFLYVFFFPSTWGPAP
ncbi:hypothetical protein H8356DRAFT_1430213 [Neocallimastix lanati (nom. inval.)]|nr:hypothetical protein H8356DRAFT_1430213 [Neocallimastix sp. JGI-2020a]